MKLNKNVFSRGAEGCPFDDSEVVMVGSWSNINLGEKATFRHKGAPDDRIEAKVIAIGDNAKYIVGGKRFTAFAVEYNGFLFIKSNEDLLLVVET